MATRNIVSHSVHGCEGEVNWTKQASKIRKSHWAYSSSTNDSWTKPYLLLANPCSRIAKDLCIRIDVIVLQMGTKINFSSVVSSGKIIAKSCQFRLFQGDVWSNFLSVKWVEIFFPEPNYVHIAFLSHTCSIRKSTWIDSSSDVIHALLLMMMHWRTCCYLINLTLLFHLHELICLTHAWWVVNEMRIYPME